MPVNPTRLFTFWEVTEDTLARYIGDLCLRVYDITGVDFDGNNAQGSFDIMVSDRIGDWYIDVGPEKEYVVDIGIMYPQGIFVTIARSHSVATPREISLEHGGLPQYLYDIGFGISSQ